MSSSELGEPLTPCLVELASGVDALYLSGRASLPGELIGRLEVAREEAYASKQLTPIRLGDVDMHLAPHAFLRYRFCLEHPYGRIGITTSSKLPTIRVQPRAEFLQGLGPRGVVEWFRNVLEDACGPVLLTVNRLDLFGDFQGWGIDGDSRHEFVCRAKSRHTYEEDGVFNGFTFGARKSGTVLARIYDKTIESTKSGSVYWKMIWGNDFDPNARVIRVEFELGRTGLREYGLNTPEEALDATGALWGSLTREWLTHRIPGADQTKSRWLISPAWESIRRARVGEDDWGIKRMYLGKRRGSIEKLTPGLVGYLASFGALAEASTLEQMLPALRDALTQDARNKGITLPERIAVRRREMGLL